MLQGTSEGALNKLYLTIGGLIVAILFAALIVPWFIDWNAYRTTFEREAEKVLGQKVTVAGSADASLLPMPSLTFTDVRVGGTPDRPMMTIERFAARIELIPLLTGEFKIVDMTLERPHVRIAVDSDGRPDWVNRSEASRELDPDAVILERLDVVDGRIDYEDAENGSRTSVTGLNAAIEAQSLLGPWKIDGGAEVAGTPVTFRVGTGRVLDDGTLRVKLDGNPASMPISVTLDGPMAIRDDGFGWSGDFILSHLAEAAENAAPPPPSWRADGKFDLDPARLRLPSFSLNEGPIDRPYTLSGALTLDLGEKARFETVLQSRQIDIDRSVGEGPGKPANVPEAVSALLAGLSDLPVPTIPGRVGFDLPGIVIGGSVIQNLRFDALPAGNGWKLEGLTAELPGRSRITADGTVTTKDGLRFRGDARFSSGQPNLFAAWWRGRPPSGQLSPFDIAGAVDLAPNALTIDNVAARLDTASLRGRIGWVGTEGGKLNLDLRADRLDFTEMRGLAELFGGDDVANGAVAHSVTLRVATGRLDIADLTLADVTVDGSYAGGALTVGKLSIGDLAGARITGSGRIDDLVGAPNGKLTAKIDAPSMAGVASLADWALTGSPLSRWLAEAAPDLGPASLSAELSARADGNDSHAELKIDGTAGGTAVDAKLGFDGRPVAWRDGALDLSVALKAEATDALLRQFGVPALPIAESGTSDVTIRATGTPSRDMDLRVSGGFSNLSFGMDGALSLDANGWPAATGKVQMGADDVAPLLALLGVTLPGEGGALPIAFEGEASADRSGGKLSFQDARIAGVVGSGDLALGFTTGRPRITGALALDAAALDFPLALGLGLPPDPLGTDDPWSRITFGRPTIGAFDLGVDLAVGQLAIGNGFTVANAALSLALAGERTELTLKSGDFAGGKASGSITLVNPEGDAAASGRFAIEKAQLSDLVWQREGRSVADGTLDLTAEFEGTGRSVTAIVSTLSGGGTIRVDNGVVRYLNPEAFGTVLRAADRGQELGEDALRDLFRAHLDAGTFSFRSAEGPFSIAAGTVRAQNLKVDADAAATIGGATVDLNRMALDSQWTLTVEPGEEDKVAGAVPQVDLAFVGPIEAPERRINVAALAGYILVRSQERLLEEVERLEAERIEQSRLGRLVRLYREAAVRRTEEAAEAEKARQEAEERRRVEEAQAEERRQREEAEAQRRAEEERQARERAEEERRLREQRSQPDSGFLDRIEEAIRNQEEQARRPAPPPPPRPDQDIQPVVPPQGGLREMNQLDGPMDLTPRLNPG